MGSVSSPFLTLAISHRACTRCVRARRRDLADYTWENVHVFLCNTYSSLVDGTEAQTPVLGCGGHWGDHYMIYSHWLTYTLLCSHPAIRASLWHRAKPRQTRQTAVVTVTHFECARMPPSSVRKRFTQPRRSTSSVATGSEAGVFAYGVCLRSSWLWRRAP